MKHELKTSDDTNDQPAITEPTVEETTEQTADATEGQQTTDGDTAE